MTCQIRNAVFETNSSSSHSVTVSADELADDYGIPKDILRSGVIRAAIKGHYGWEWHRYYDPGAKIAYLATQLAGRGIHGTSGQDVTALVRREPRVAYMLDLIEQRTGCRVEVIGAGNPSIDHDSVGLGVDLLGDEDELMRFIFGSKSFVQTGNDNSDPPMNINTDYGGSERYHEYRYVADPVVGRRFEFTIEIYGSNIFMHPEGGEPVYASVDDRFDMQKFLEDLDGMTLEKIDVWMSRSKDVELSLAEEFAQEAVHVYLTDLERVIPGMKFSEGMKIETAFDLTNDGQTVYTLKAAADPAKVDRMMAILARHSGLDAHPSN